MSRKPLNKIIKIKPKNEIKKRVCRLIDDGKPCRKPVHCRGVCARHHTYLLRWVMMDKYGEKVKFVYFDDSDYSIDHKAKNRCRLIENGKKCYQPIHGRGLCKRDYLKLQRHGTLDDFGTPSQKRARKLTLNRNHAPGICRLKEDKIECTKPAKTRGLCGRHYIKVGREGKLDKFGSKPFAGANDTRRRKKAERRRRLYDKGRQGV